MTKVAVSCLLGIFLAQWALASEQVGTLTQLEGKVDVFSHPSKTLPDSSEGGERALFEGEYYVVRAAKPGEHVELGNIVRTAPDAKARVVFENGDQFNVGPGTAYRVFWKQDAADTDTRVNLMYGKLRGVVAKGGPRTHLEIKTKTATMGVRGTDFFVDDSGDRGTEISVVRGAVAVTSAGAGQGARPIEVKSGFSARTADEPSTPIEIHQTTRGDLMQIQAAARIEAPQAAPAPVAPKIEALEAKAVQTTLRDIKNEDPALYAQLEQRKFERPEDVNGAAVENLAKTAPQASSPVKIKKPASTDLERDDSTDNYEKYFKPAQ